MKLSRLASRVVVGGTAAVLAAAGLVGVTSTSASAAPVSTTYNCSVPGGSAFPVPVTVDIALLPSTAPAGFPVPPGLLSFNSTASIPDAVQTQLDLLGVNGGKSDDFAATFSNASGTTPAKSSVSWTKPASSTGGFWVYTGKGANAAFTLPAAGTYAVSMPKAFTLQPTKDGAATGITAVCTSANPAQIGAITLSKQASVTKAKGPKSAKVGDVVALKVTVTDDYSKSGGVIPSGKLIVKDGKKKVGSGKLNKKGKAKIKVKGLKKGKHKLVVFYKGDKYNEKSKSKPVKLTVKG